VADAARLGVGWSYGVLTNQVIARDRRFKAAISGAGQSNALAGYGTDQYIRQYESELGNRHSRAWDARQSSSPIRESITRSRHPAAGGTGSNVTWTGIIVTLRGRETGPPPTE
jgi:hypothetical protein